MLCPNCNYDNTFYGEFRKLEYCLNCGQDLKKPVQVVAGGELYDTLLEIDEVAGELLIKEESIFGSPKVDKRIPLSEIQEVTCGAETQYSQTGFTDFYMGYCDLLIGGVWQSFSLGSERDALRVAAAIGRRLENPQEKSRELVNHLYKLFGVSMTTDKEQRVGLQEPLRLPEEVTLTTKFTIDAESPLTQARALQSWRAKGRVLEIEGMIPLHDSDVDNALLLHTDVPDHYYLLGYSVTGKTIDSVWTHRKKRVPLFGKSVGMEWRGGALSEQLNNDDSLQELLLDELGTSDCDAHVTNDQSSGNTVIIFGDCYPRQWVRLPESLFPSESRVKAVKMIAKKVREFTG